MKSNNAGSDLLGAFNISESDTFLTKTLNSYFTNTENELLMDNFCNKPDYNYDNPIDYIPFSGSETPSYLCYNKNSPENINASNNSNSHQSSNESLEMTYLNMILQLLDTTQHNYSNDPSECPFNVDNADSNDQIFNDNLNNGMCNFTPNQLDSPFPEGDLNTFNNEAFDFDNEVENQDFNNNCENFLPFEDCASDSTVSCENDKGLDLSFDKGIYNTKKTTKLSGKKHNTNNAVSDVYVSWIPKNARCKLSHELPCTIEECEKYPEYVLARDRMLLVLKKLGFFHIESITFHPPKGSHIIIRFLNKRLETLFLQRYKESPYQWKLDMYKHFKISKKVIGSIKNLRVDIVNKNIKSKNSK